MPRRRNKRPDKAICQRAHARKRALSRYGVDLTRNAQELIIYAIQSGNPKLALFLEKESTRLSRWMVCYEGRFMPVIYDNQRKTIVTVLPRSVLQDYKIDPLTGQYVSDIIDTAEASQATAHIPQRVSEEVRGCTVQGGQLMAAERELRESATETIPQPIGL